MKEHTLFNEHDFERRTIKSIRDIDVDKRFIVYCKIEDIALTAGPTLFTFSDGTGTIKAKAFRRPGVRAFEELSKGQIICALVRVEMWQGDVELDFEKYITLSEEKVKEIIDEFQQSLHSKAIPITKEFLIQSETLEKLKDRFIHAATVIRQAILESRPIIVRHDSDCDGFSAAVALERAILPKILLQHKSETAQYHYYRRIPSKTPFYDYADATKDISTSIEEMSRFGRKEPLIIIVDNGSGTEDILGIRKVKIYNAQVIVVDHHYPGEIIDGTCEVDKYLDGHINPHLVGGGFNICSGMLCVELARFIYKDVDNVTIIGAISGTADRVSGTEYDQYIEYAKQMGFSHEYLKDLAEVIDFEAQYLKFLDARGLVNDILGADFDKQRQLVNLLTKDIKERRRMQLEVSKAFHEKREFDSFVMILLDIDKLTIRGEFPAAGKTVGLTSDYYITQFEKPIMVVGHTNNFMIIRTNLNNGFNLNHIITSMQKSYPHWMITGGGHEKAGTIKFISQVKDDVLKYVEHYIVNLRND